MHMVVKVCIVQYGMQWNEQAMVQSVRCTDIVDTVLAKRRRACYHPARGKDANLRILENTQVYQSPGNSKPTMPTNTQLCQTQIFTVVDPS